MTLSSVAATNGNQVGITVNGAPIGGDADAFLRNGKTYAPVRFLCEAMFEGCEFYWDENTKTVTVNTGGDKLIFRSGNTFVTINDRYIPLDNEIILKGGRLFIPVRAFSERVGASVSWDAQSYSAAVITNSSELKLAPPTYTADDVYWLSRIIYAESGSESFNGMLAVGSVVLNRVKSPEYPDTVYDVIFDKTYGVQFTPVSNGTIYNTPPQECIIAAKLCLEGYKSPVGDSLYFLNPSTSVSSWVANNKQYVQTIGNHKFYA